MSDSKPPKPAAPKYLPRTWKAPEEPAEEPQPGPAKKKAKASRDKAKDPETKPKKKKKKADDDGDVLENGPKLEETPLLDTYEARQRIRWVIGGVLGLVGFVLIMVLVRTFQPAPAKVDVDADRREARPAVDPKESNEREAAVLVENAKRSDREGQDKNAILLLKKVLQGYDGTDAAKEAKAALARESQNRPLFGPDPTKPAGPVAPVAAAVAPTPSGPNAGPVPPVVAVALPAAPTPPAPPRPPEIVVRPLPNGFRIEPGAGIHPSGWPLRITCDRDKAAMVLVPGGEFLMGREDGERQERPSHRVKLVAYYIDEHEVTNRQYQAYLEETGRAADLARGLPGGPGEAPKAAPAPKPDLPVTGLTAREAQAYCYWANRRLPTEAQWELAARSTDGRVAFPIPRGDPRTLEPVMANPADRSPLGGYDFAGNAWEWTADYYDSNYYNSLKDLTLDPTGPAQSRIKPAQAAVKGGSPAGSLTWRQGVAIDTHRPVLGFRGALPVEAQATAPNAAGPGGAASPPPGGGVPF